ncbi:hypothetical protein POTOM_011453 [Populus tomentosa]|uniref:Uncharacterized protein n=1 Tax=Populus tomentosa TaxID=118781 RepID=A0A8X8AJ44_POPTO|nr:hypothetical protein POTOM_011453 [Populus tomentosa]
MQTDSEQQDRLGKLNGIWFGSYRLRANLKRFQQENTDSQHRIPIKKHVQRVSVPVRECDCRSYSIAKRENPASTRQLQSNAYPVTQTEDINVALVIQDNIINAVPVVQPVPSLVITHDPEEEELAWMENSLVGVISEGVNYKNIRKGLLSNGVQLAGFRFMGASQALISFNKHKKRKVKVFTPTGSLKQAMAEEVEDYSGSLDSSIRQGNARYTHLRDVPVPEKTGKDDEVQEMLNAGQVLGFRSADDLAILFWNSCGRGVSDKRMAVKNMILQHNIDICILLETKRRICTPSFAYAMWNDPNVKCINTTSLIDGQSAGFRLVHSKAILSICIISSLTDAIDAPASLSKMSFIPSLAFIFDLTQSTMLLPSPMARSGSYLYFTKFLVRVWTYFRNGLKQYSLPTSYPGEMD